MENLASGGGLSLVEIVIATGRKVPILADGRRGMNAHEKSARSSRDDPSGRMNELIPKGIKGTEHR